MPTSWADASEGDEARGAGDSMPGNHVDRVARYVQAAEALEVLQGRVRENTGEVGNLLFDRWAVDDLHELACLARDARDAKLEGFMRGEEAREATQCGGEALPGEEDRPEPGGRRKATG
eukprot:s8000_g6.t1